MRGISEEQIFIGGQFRKTETCVEVRCPFNGELLGRVGQGTKQDAEEACGVAEAAFQETRELPGWKRFEILTAASRLIAERSEEFARTVALESGKAIRDARGEVARAVQTFQVAAEESKRIGGEVLPLDWLPGSDGRAAIIRRFPVGPVLGITPFNFPLNLVAHKVAPALAAGNPIVIKPAPQTPFSALMLGELLMEAGCPPKGVSVLPCSNDVAATLLHDPRMRKLSFTGSGQVGWELKRQVPKKRVTLELGGNAAVIVHQDADIAHCASRIVSGAFALAGQSCISVQRVFAHQAIFQSLLDAVAEGASEQVVGDPLDDRTQVASMINEAAARRAEAWIQEAIDAGAKLVTGGQRDGAILHPAVLSHVPAHVNLACEEAFAPVVFVNPYHEFEEALAMVNNSPYGLQAGVFTRDWSRIAAAFRTIEAGAVLVNEVPTWRADHMPYGGVKDSGVGREGLRSAIESMTEERLLILPF